MLGLDWTEETETSGKQVPGVRRQEMKAGVREEVVVSAGKKVSIPRDEIYGVNFLRRNLIFYNLLGNVGGQNLERKKSTIIVGVSGVYCSMECTVHCVVISH